MKLNIKNFKKVSSDKDYTVMRDAKGHEIKISHKPLSSEYRKQLDSLPVHMADGGEVSKAEDSNDAAKKIQQGFNSNTGASGVDKAIDNFKKALGFADGGEVEQNQIPIATSQEQLQQQAPQPLPQQPININVNAAPQQAPQMPYGADANQAYGVSQPPQAAQQQQQAPQMQPASTQQEAPQPAPAEQAPPAQSLAPQQPLQADPYGNRMAGQTYMQGLGEQLQGIKGQAQAEGAASRAQAQAHANAANLEQKIMTDSMARYNRWMADGEHMYKQIQDQKIDPNRFVNNMSTGGKVWTTIGMILGGMGSGKDSPAFKMLDDHIARDIDAQKAELGKKQSLFGAAMQMTGETRQAAQLATAFQEKITAHQIEQAGLKQGGQLAMSRALQASGQLKQQASDRLKSLALNQTMMDTLGQANSDPQNMGKMLQAMRMVNPEMAKEMEGRYVPGVGLAQVPVPQDIRQQMAASKHLDEQLQQLEEFAKQHSGTMFDRSVINKGKAMAAQVQDAYRQANKQGVFKESEADFIERSIKQDPTAFFSNFRTLPGYEVTRSNNRSLLNNLYKTYGLEQQKIPTAAPVPVK